MSEERIVNIHVPVVNERNTGRVYEIFAYEDITSMIKLNYVEPIASDNIALWRIEYRYNITLRPEPALTAFVAQLKQAIGPFEYDSIYHNFSGRIYLHVLPNGDLIKGQSPIKTVVKKKSRSSKRRDQLRADRFKQQVSDLKSKAIEKGYESKQQQDFIPLVKQKTIYSRYLRRTDSLSTTKPSSSKTPSRVSFVSGGFTTPTLRTSSSTQTSDVPSQPKPPMITPDAQAKIIELSAKANAVYAKGKLLDERIFSRVRKYLAVFYDNADYSYIDSRGDSRLSLELLLKSDGFPIGKELYAMYSCVMLERGYDLKQVEDDLKGLRSFEQTSRTIRLQTAREKMQKWYETPRQKLSLVHQDYFKIETQSMNKTSCATVNISDSLGPIAVFA